MHFMNRRSFAGGVAALAASTMLPAIVLGQDEDDTAESSELLGQIPGLRTAYARRYDPADSHTHIELDGEDIEVTEETPDHLVVMALEFGSAAELTGVLGMMLNADTARLILGSPDIELTEEPAGDFPRGSVLFHGTDTNRDEYESLLVIPVDNIGYAINTTGATDAVQVTSDAIGAHLVEQEVSDTPVVVISEGVAEGGVFDAFPGVDDLEMLNGLIPMYDYDLLVNESPILPTDATPAASPTS